MSQYKKGQLIWAKIKGYPWWPGVVAKTNVDKHGNVKKDVVVNFIGENSHAILPQDKVADFVEKRKQHSLSKNKKLQESIQIADKILDGTITYEQERNRLEELEGDSSDEEGSSDDGSENQENELASSSRSRSRSHSSSSKKSDAISTSEALWKDNDSILNTKDRKDSVDKISIDLDRSIDKSQSIDSDQEKPTKTEKKKKKEKEENKEKPQKLKKKDSLPQQKKLSKANSVQESSKGKNSNPEKSRKPSVQKSAKDATPIKSRKIKGKLLIDEDGEVENFWKSPQNLATKPNKASSPKNVSSKPNKTSHSESENLVKMAEEPQTVISEKLELIKSKSVPDVKPATMEEEREYQINEESDGEKEEEKLSKKKLKLENRSVDIPNPLIVNEEPVVISHEQHMRENNLKKFENDLERLLRQLSTKLKESIKLEENDSDILSLLEVMEEFETKQLQGAELVNSKIGKIFKTVHYILIRYKPQLPENCDIIITAVAKILHIIKNKIMKFSLDNSEYLNILKIIPENEQQQMMEFSMVNLLDLNFEKIRMKVEENEKAEAKVPFPLVAKAPIPEISKIEEEEEERIELPFKEDVLLPLLPEQHPAATDILSDIKNIARHRQEDFIEEQTDGLASISLRKKVCKKIAKLLQKCYLLEKNSAQELTIQIEDKLNRFNNGKENEYKQTIKVIHKLMKARKLKLDELNNLDDNNINNILKFQIHQVTKKI